jgi:glucokinase
MLTARGTAPRVDRAAPGLIADIGGTNARFALIEANGTIRDAVVLTCRSFPDLTTAVESYLAAVAPALRPQAAAIAIACPVTGDRVAMTNHPWSFSVEAVRRGLGLASLTVLNDFVAIALAVPRLGIGDRYQVGGPEPAGMGGAAPADPIAVIGPGTGLGVGGLVSNGGRWLPVPSEGGHITMPAVTEREAEVLRILRRRFDHVSAERVVSGPGLVNLYRALCAIEGAAADDNLRPDQVAARAMEGSCPRCAEALALFCAMLGTVAGDLCLTYGARGGLYIAGGIVPQLEGYFAASDFRRRFEDKGRFAAYLAAIPAYVVTRETPAFLGLAGLLAENATF